MSVPILAAKLYSTAPRPGIVTRPRLIERLNKGLAKGVRLTLISAPAGFGKTTLVSEWIAQCERPVAWLSLDEGDDDLTRFLSYLIAALQTLKAGLGESLLAMLQSHQPPQPETIVTTLLNDMSSISSNFVLVLDDYHVIDCKPIDEAITLIVERLPPQMHLVIATREDPHLHLARLRARGQLTELRAADLRFLPTEAADFLSSRFWHGVGSYLTVALTTTALVIFLWKLIGHGESTVDGETSFRFAVVFGIILPGRSHRKQKKNRVLKIQEQQKKGRKNPTGEVDINTM